MMTMIRRLNVLRRQPRPVRFLLARFLWRTRLCTWFDFQYNGFRLKFHPSAFSARLWRDREQHREDDQFFADYLRPGDVVVDVGANIGTLSLAASRIVGATGKVIAIEAHPRTFRFLQSNLRRNLVNNVDAYNLAAGRAAGTLCFSDKTLDDQNTVLNDGPGIAVPVRTLDALLASEPRIHLLKIDVEGYEKFVFEGAGRVLDRTDVVYFEAFQRHLDRFGYGFADLWRILSARGFSTFRFVERQELAPIHADYVPEQCENFLAMRNANDFVVRTHFQCQTIFPARNSSG